MAKRFVREGANVTLTARSEEKLTAVAGEVDGTGAGDVLVEPADLTKEAAVRTMVERTVEEFGEITALVNNAAVGLLSLYDERKQLHQVDPADFRYVLAVNVTGAFYCSKFVVPHLIEADGGSILNVSSGFGRRGAPGFGPYVVSKFALEGMTQAQAMELEEDGITVNAIDPGGRVDTGFWDHLPDDERAEILDPDVMNEAATLLLAQGPGGVTGDSASTSAWERRLG